MRDKNIKKTDLIKRESTNCNVFGRDMNKKILSTRNIMLLHNELVNAPNLRLEKKLTRNFL